MTDIESAITPTQLVERFAKAGIHISERTLRDKARQIGAYRLIGKAMFLMPEDVEALLEASRPKIKTPAAAAPAFKPSIGSDYEELLRIRAKTSPRSSSKAKR